MTPEPKHSERTFQLIAESLPGALILVNGEGQIVFANIRAGQLFGYNPKELTGQNIEVLLPAALNREQTGLKALFLSSPRVPLNGAAMALFAQKKNGTGFAVEICFTALIMAGGSFMLITITDIGERKKNEAQQSLFASIVNSSDDAILSKTLDGKITSWNHGAEKVFGYSATEIIGKDISILIPPVLRKEEREIMEKIHTGGEVSHYETERIRKDGKVINVTLTISPIKDSLGNIIGASKISRDITERKRSEVEKEKRAAELIIANKELAFQNEEKEKRAAELVIANKELAFQNGEKEKRAAELILANRELAFQNDEKEKRAAELSSVNDELESFSYSVSHDLRAPLRAVHGYAQMLQEDYGTQLDAEGCRKVNTIMKNAKKMGQLIDDLLSFSRLGRRDLQVNDIRMHDMVEGICQELKNEQGPRNIEFRVQDLLPAKADNITIKQAWVNLISNAIKYSKLKDKAIIEIGSEIKDNEIIYHVKDNGAGFDMRYANKLFGVFQRLHSDERFEGTGVGLAIVKRIISKHKGRVWAEGKINEGATFYFSLPK